MSSLVTSHIKVLKLSQHDLNQRAACLTEQWMKNPVSREAAVYILPLGYSLLFKVFHLAACDHQKL